MDLVSSWNMRVTQFPAPTITNFSSLSLFKPSYSFHNLAFPFYNMIPNKYCAVQAKKRSSESKSVLKQDLVEDVLMEEDEEEEVLFEDFDDGTSNPFPLSSPFGFWKFWVLKFACNLLGRRIDG